MTTDEQNSKNLGMTLLGLALVLVVGIAIVVWGIVETSKNNSVKEIPYADLLLKNFRLLTESESDEEAETVEIEDVTNEIIIMRSKVSRMLNEIAEKRANQ